MFPPLHGDPLAFGGLEGPPDLASARFAVLPIPYDGTSTWLKGADRGPAAILEASANLELFDIETGLEPFRAGILTLAPIEGDGSPEGLAARVREAAGALIEAGKTVVGLGGEHSIAIGLIQAHAARYPCLTVLQFDAHADTRDSYQGSGYNHACVMARAAEVADCVRVGIRSMDASERAALSPERTFYAHQIAGRLDFIPRLLAVLGDPVYITIDLDCLDPGVMPSTGTPEPGGMDWYQLTRTLAAVIAARRVVGFDVNELLPNPANRAPDFLAARLVYQIMGYLVAREHRATGEGEREWTSANY